MRPLTEEEEEGGGIIDRARSRENRGRIVSTRRNRILRKTDLY